MSTVRNSILVGGLAVFAIGGALWTNAREANSECGQLFYTENVQQEMRDYFREESNYYGALVAGAASENVADSDRALYQEAVDRLDSALEETKVVGLMKHPSNTSEKTCYLSLSFSNLLNDLDLGQRSLLGFTLDREFEIVSRFKIRFEEIEGTELASRIERQRDNWLIEPIAAGDLVESAEVAKLTRRAFQITEPGVPFINYQTSFTATEGIEAGFFGS